MTSVLITRLQLQCRFRKRVLQLSKVTKKSVTTTEADIVCEADNEVKVKFNGSDEMKFSSGRLAKLADGSAVVTYKNTTVMGTAVSKDRSKASSSFVPLTVSYHQKAAALGRIPLNFLRREIGVSELEVLTSRLVDRSIRPLFPKGFNWETQIICSPLAIDGSNFPDVLAVNAASAALAVSDIPWDGPVGAVRVGLIDEEPILNPTKLELVKSKLNLVITVRNQKTLLMLEGTAANVLQQDLFKCFKFGMKHCQKIVSGISELRKLVGKTKKTFEPKPINPVLLSTMEALSEEGLRNIFRNHTLDKLSRDEAVSVLHGEVLEKLKPDFGEEDMALATQVFYTVCKKVFRDLIFETETRCDGRGLKELRPITCEVNLFEPLHGSALFQRGQTQVLCTVALDSPDSALKMDKISMLASGLKEKNFFVHYEFPPFATKDMGRMGSVGRREIGHGILAERALQSNIPEDYPFTIRLTSEVLESNGSSSMGTVCAGTLALLDAGVPLLNPCAGVALGFISKSNEEDEIVDYRILTDLLGIEDYYGEMDFKIAGTKKGYTAFQLDVKNRGIPVQIFYKILEEGKNAISEVLSIMRKACPNPRTQRKSCWPTKETVSVPVHSRMRFLGPGWANIKKLEATTGVEVSEEDIGEFTVFAPNEDAMKEAKEVISTLLEGTIQKTLEFGCVYSAKITEIRDSGCMVTLYPSMKPVHIPLSQLDVRQVKHPCVLGLREGQEINVKYFGHDPVSGAMRLSRKVLLGPASEVLQSFHKSTESSKNQEPKEEGCKDA